MNLDAYIRVSRVGGRAGETFISPTAQREKITKFADLHGHRVVRLHEDLDQPGSNAARPGFQAALARVEAGETDGIVVTKLDRFARSVADAAVAIRRLRDAGGQLVSVEDNFDSSTPMGRFAVNMILGLAELELERIRESWSTAQEHAVRRGIHIASRCPTGYQRRKDGRLERHPRYADNIAEVFRQRAAGASWRDLVTYLEANKVVGPYGNKHWTTAAVSKLIANRVYTGEARSGRHQLADAHPALVTPSEWRAAQGKGTPSTPRNGDGALLAGLLRCSGCRYILKPDTMRGRDGQQLRIYRCRGDHAAGRCPAPATVMGRVVEPYIVKTFFAALGPDGVLARAIPDDREVDEAQRLVSDAELELEAFLGASVVDLGREVYRAGLELRQRAVDEARARLDDVAARMSAAGVPAVADLEATWPDLTLAERRRILTAGIDAVILRRGRGLIGERTLVLWRDEAPDDLPRRGRRVALESFKWDADEPGVARVAVA
jgi:site-specific DNA recombinase